MKLSKAKSSEAALSASSALVGVHSISSLEPELSSISDPEAVDDVIDEGKWNDDFSMKPGFQMLTLEEFGLLVVKLHSSQNVKVLNLSGNTMNADTMHELAGHLGMLMALQEINLRRTNNGAEGAGRLAEPLGKLTALQKLNLSCTV